MPDRAYPIQCQSPRCTSYIGPRAVPRMTTRWDGLCRVCASPSDPREKLRYYVSGAIERGEGEPIVEVRADA